MRESCCDSSSKVGNSTSCSYKRPTLKATLSWVFSVWRPEFQHRLISYSWLFCVERIYLFTYIHLICQQFCWRVFQEFYYGQSILIVLSILFSFCEARPAVTFSQFPPQMVKWQKSTTLSGRYSPFLIRQICREHEHIRIQKEWPPVSTSTLWSTFASQQFFTNGKIGLTLLWP